MTYRNTNKDNMDKKPRFTPLHILQKFALSADIKPPTKTPVYYEWDKKRFPKWNKELTKPVRPYFQIGYDGKKKEWYASYIVSRTKITIGTIDDVTGSVSLSTN